IKGAKRNAVVLNAAASIYIAGKADSKADGIKVAEDMIDSGKAPKTLHAFERLTKE
ncbi:anthranilate phosphoribosyltransferase, partial [Coprococcus eutactus]|nr:anthranilate phosphoribosyltransferase [Coprococcus eutactus]